MHRRGRPGEQGRRHHTCGSEVFLRSVVQRRRGSACRSTVTSTPSERCQAKDLMRRRTAWRRAHTRLRRARTFDEVEAFVAGQGLPVVSALARWGQRGVLEGRSHGELAPSYDGREGRRTTGVVLVEEFVEGDEFSVNAYTKAGVTTVCSVTNGVNHAVPPSLPDHVRRMAPVGPRPRSRGRQR